MTTCRRDEFVEQGQCKLFIERLPRELKLLYLRIFLYTFDDHRSILTFQLISDRNIFVLNRFFSHFVLIPPFINRTNCLNNGVVGSNYCLVETVLTLLQKIN